MGGYSEKRAKGGLVVEVVVEREADVEDARRIRELSRQAGVLGTKPGRITGAGSECDKCEFSDRKQSRGMRSEGEGQSCWRKTPSPPDLWGSMQARMAGSARHLRAVALTTLLRVWPQGDHSILIKKTERGHES